MALNPLTGKRQGNKRTRQDHLKERFKKAQKDKREGPAQGDLAKWQWLMDPAEVSDREFIETVFDVKLAGSDDPEFDDEVEHDLFAPFILRPAQGMLEDAIDEEWRAGRGAKITNLKARQHGISTYGMAKLAVRVLRRIGDGTVVCQDEQATLEMFEKLRNFIKQVPEWARPKSVKDRENVIRFEHRPGKTSSIRLLTAGKHALGRSMTNHWLWISEFAFWPERAKKELPGLLKTFHNRPGNFVVIECTAKGYEQFHRRYYAAVKRRGGWRAEFYNWLIHPDYRIGFASDAEREVFAKSVGREDRFGGETETMLVEQHAATLEQLNFRRHEIEGDLEGHIPTWNQEFPTIPEDAFISTGRPVFQIDVLKAYLPLAEEKERNAKQGNLLLKGFGKEQHIEFQKDYNGIFTIYEEPVEGEVYCWGEDIAGGWETQADGVHEADYSSLKMKHLLSGRTVAKLRTHIFPKELAGETAKLCFWYGMASGFPEKNMDGGTVIEFMLEEEIGGHSGAEMIRTKFRLQRQGGTRVSIEEYGFYTSKQTKLLAVGMMKGFINEIGMPGPTTDWKLCPFDLNTIKEALRYVHSPSGAMAAAEGHDDDVMSECLALVARRDAWDEVEKLSRVPAKRSPLDDHFAALMEQRRTTMEQKEPGWDHRLGVGF